MPRPNYARKSLLWDENESVGLTVTAAPTIEPVTPQEISTHARIDIHNEDGWVLDAIKAARELCEVYTKRCFIDTTLKMNMDRFPIGEFFLRRPRLISVTSIKYLDTNGTQQTLSTSNYSVDTKSEPGRLVPAYNLTWPDTRTDTNAIEIIYHAGYGTTADTVPFSIKQAIKITVANWYENREDQGKLPDAAKTLLACESWGYLP
jgi:uncharacterized phiE125 gp8 family phage protein